MLPQRPTALCCRPRADLLEPSTRGRGALFCPGHVQNVPNVPNVPNVLSQAQQNRSMKGIKSGTSEADWPRALPDVIEELRSSECNERKPKEGSSVSEA